MVDDHVVMLHGDTANDQEAAGICQAVLDVAGVRGVRSHLHVGLLASDTRPSIGRARQRRSSAALDRFVRAAIDAGAVNEPLFAVRSVLGTFLERVPEGERAHVLAHLPADVRMVAVPPQIWGDDRARNTARLIAEVARTDPSLDERTAASLVDAMLAVLAELVPEERDDVAAVLPHDLRELWQPACDANTERPGVPAAV